MERADNEETSANILKPLCTDERWHICAQAWQFCMQAFDSDLLTDRQSMPRGHVAALGPAGGQCPAVLQAAIPLGACHE